MEITFRLMQESGVSGPVKTVTLENPDPHPVALRRMARAWADGQTGHPWDVLTVTGDGIEPIEIDLTK